MSIFGIAAIVTEKGDSAVAKELIIHTTSTSAVWTPSNIVNSGDPLTWGVSGGVTIADAEFTGNNVPTFNLSSNGGTAIITVSSFSSFVGLTELQLNGNQGSDSVTFLNILEAVELVLFSTLGALFSVLWLENWHHSWRPAVYTICDLWIGMVQ